MARTVRHPVRSLRFIGDEVLPIATQIAEALEAAHAQGIIHRDLKPANIKLRPDGTIKVLDFGLAKALEPAVTSADMAHSPTITSPAMTRMGVIVGTAAYMSPEQAKDRAADKRSDVWAFGCVLYEMVTGGRAFEGEDVSVVRGAEAPRADQITPRSSARGSLARSHSLVAFSQIPRFSHAEPAKYGLKRSPLDGGSAFHSTPVSWKSRFLRLAVYPSIWTVRLAYRCCGCHRQSSNRCLRA
jgi:serine/threonine protein kinase